MDSVGEDFIGESYSERRRVALSDDRLRKRVKSKAAVEKISWKGYKTNIRLVE